MLHSVASTKTKGYQCGLALGQRGSFENVCPFYPGMEEHCDYGRHALDSFDGSAEMGGQGLHISHVVLLQSVAIIYWKCAPFWILDHRCFVVFCFCSAVWLQELILKGDPFAGRRSFFWHRTCWYHGHQEDGQPLQTFAQASWEPKWPWHSCGGWIFGTNWASYKKYAVWTCVKIICAMHVLCVFICDKFAALCSNTFHLKCSC